MSRVFLLVAVFLCVTATACSASDEPVAGDANTGAFSSSPEVSGPVDGEPEVATRVPESEPAPSVSQADPPLSPDQAAAAYRAAVEGLEADLVEAQGLAAEARYLESCALVAAALEQSAQAVAATGNWPADLTPVIDDLVAVSREQGEAARVCANSGDEEVALPLLLSMEAQAAERESLDQTARQLLGLPVA